LNNAQNITINMVNTLGQVVSTETRELSAGNNLIQMNTADLPNGIYFLNVISGDSQLTSKFVKQ
ncbi:MAG TPA: T9SS type A sorting domain-containing protein, partial [Bacteroidia bacterium]|nr:T9SS type A sorting domain-containing protein [Bacteroidia bacterium]